jgi:[ribosomal protein S5]-alanine N-acetyltransferase
MLILHFTPFPILKTKRLLLRKMVLEDAPALFFLRSDESVLKYLNKEPSTGLQEIVYFISSINKSVDEDETIMWAITLKENPALLIGTVCFWNISKENHRAEIGYLLHPQYWGRGIMTETLLQVIDYGFSVLKFHSITAVINPDNTGSATILEKLGFVKEAHFKEDVFFRGKFLDSAVYSKLNNGTS